MWHHQKCEKLNVKEFDLEKELEEIRRDVNLLGQKMDMLLSKHPLDLLTPKNTCGKCGLRLEGVMGYVCSDPNCPTFFNVRSAKSNTGGL